MLIKVDDIVEVISGRDKGQRGKVLVVDREKGRVVVEGLNKVYKHVKRSQRNPQGGRLSKEAAMSVSKVMLVCPSTGKPTRVGVRYLPDGSKERYSKRSGTTISKVAPGRKFDAK
ncbi:MAG: 50S ribosomal protein L24 [Planctomycetes bacterium]|nr:50S ribosomal protein L24 [Planctomycetota bacterium]